VTENRFSEKKYESQCFGKEDVPQVQGYPSEGRGAHYLRRSAPQAAAGLIELAGTDIIVGSPLMTDVSTESSFSDR
jgi:hypothetical protein